MTEHTPTPWRVRIESHADYITDRNGYAVMGTHHINCINPDDQKEVADLIVEAVNNHESLKVRVKELEEALKGIEQLAVRHVKLVRARSTLQEGMVK